MEITNISEANSKTESISKTNIVSVQPEYPDKHINPEDLLPFKLDRSYKGDELTAKVAKILNLDTVKGWSIVDHQNDLCLVHYDDDADMHIFGHLRGVLVDVANGCVISPIFGYTPTAVTNDLELVDGKLTITDQDNHTHVFPQNEMVIRRIFEGVVMRVIWYNGRSYHLTHRKIEPIKSHWGKSPTFMAMYELAGGPKDEELFDTTKKYCNQSYTFLIVHPDLLVGTRQVVETPYIVHLATSQIDFTFPKDEYAKNEYAKDEYSEAKPTFITNRLAGGLIDKPFIHTPPNLPLANANYHLRYGYYNQNDTLDTRQWTGEAVIIYHMVQGKIMDIVKVHSIAYEWRQVIRGNNPNIMNQFYSLLNTVYPDIKDEQAWDNFKKRYILFPIYDEKHMNEFYESYKNIVSLPQHTVYRKDYENREARIHLLWINFVLALPPHMQKEGLGILQRFHYERDGIINWLQTLEAQHRDLNQLPEDIPLRIKKILMSARVLAKQRIQDGSNFSYHGTYMKMPVVIKSVIRNLINKENGTSLYTIVRYSRKLQEKANLPDKPADKSVELPADKSVELPEDKMVNN